MLDLTRANICTTFLLAYLAVFLHGVAAGSEPEMARMSIANGGKVEGQGDTPPGLNIQTDMDAMHFLMRMGWMMPQSTEGMTMDSMESPMMNQYHTGLEEYQEAFGLEVTGKADSRTMEAMRQPRCSVPDRDMSSGVASFTTRTKWRKQRLTYRIQSYTSDLPRSQTKTTVREAFNYWERVADLRFTEVSSGGDIVIQFVSGNHGDGNSFDGRGGVLAHAYFPQNGDAHFDDAETWTINTRSGTNFLQVAVHEFGHSLGLGHSMDRAAIMYPTYRGYIADFKLGRDDINGIRSLYGAPVAQTTTRRTTRGTTTRPTAPPRGGSACEVKKWDAVVTTQDRTTYFFVGSVYYKAGDQTARSVSRDWGVRGRVNAAVTLSNGYTLLFQDRSFYLYKNQRRYGSRPRTTALYFRGLPSSFDAAWIFSRNKKFYVTKGSQYWRHNSRQENSPYPRDFNSAWRGAPNSIDAATTDGENELHFFSGPYYYTLNSRSVSVQGGRKSVAKDWFQCDVGRLEDDSSEAAGGDEEGDAKMMELEMKDTEDDVTDGFMKMMQEDDQTDSASVSGVSFVLALVSAAFVYAL